MFCAGLCILLSVLSHYLSISMMCCVLSRCVCISLLGCVLCDVYFLK